MKISDLPQKLFLYIKEVILEAKKINWPGFKETVKYTIIVILSSVVVAIILGGFDIIFTTILKEFIFRK